MSKRVKARLRRMKILEKTDHEDRVELDRLIEEKTRKPCDEELTSYPMKISSTF